MRISDWSSDVCSSDLPRAKGSGIDGPAPLYGNSLFADLTRIKTQIVQEGVASNPALALDVLLDSLAGQLLHGGRSYQMALEVQAKAVPTDVPDELMATRDRKSTRLNSSH